MHQRRFGAFRRQVDAFFRDPANAELVAAAVASMERWRALSDAEREIEHARWADDLAETDWC